MIGYSDPRDFSLPVVKTQSKSRGDYFGYSVAISGDTIVVGAHKEAPNQTTITNDTTASSDNSLTDSGAAYVYKRQLRTQ